MANHNDRIVHDSEYFLLHEFLDGVEGIDRSNYAQDGHLGLFLSKEEVFTFSVLSAENGNGRHGNANCHASANDFRPSKRAILFKSEVSVSSKQVIVSAAAKRFDKFPYFFAPIFQPFLHLALVWESLRVNGANVTGIWSKNCLLVQANNIYCSVFDLVLRVSVGPSHELGFV